MRPISILKKSLSGFLQHKPRGEHINTSLVISDVLQSVAAMTSTDPPRKTTSSTLFPTSTCQFLTTRGTYQVRDSPRPLLPLNPLSGVEGKTARLTCTVRSRGDRTVSWIRRGVHPVVMSSGGVTFTSDTRYEKMIINYLQTEQLTPWLQRVGE